MKGKKKTNISRLRKYTQLPFLSIVTPWPLEEPILDFGPKYSHCQTLDEQPFYLLKNEIKGRLATIRSGAYGQDSITSSISGVSTYVARTLKNVDGNSATNHVGRSTTEAIHLVWRLLEQYKDKKRDLHMVFIDLEKTCDKVPREALWRCLTVRGDSEHFPIVMGLHKESTLSLFLFALVMDVLTQYSQGEVLWCLFLVDDIVLTDEMPDGVNDRMEVWRESKRGASILTSQERSHKYLGSVIQGDRAIDDDVAHYVGVDGRMGILREMIKNGVIWYKVGVASMADKMREAMLRWFGHVKKRCKDEPVRRHERLGLIGVRRNRGKPKKN
ncbi:hypothetical protein H5410_006610 [Solanum commersonii]|uniref:Reverse transcriptase domain-containing protein n=1 Tax=Solanum commersonii TaxID=4109 RepID=A0A9J6AAB1_SOLCO|nr:hypothetical protein H5410_006610 [Solanum commersonii]